MFKLNKFCFMPVGQGLFYIGSLDSYSYNFVYDCGTENNIKVLDECISRVMDSNIKHLDFCVLSHFHEDHIKGIDLLFKKFNNFKVYVPYFNGTKNEITFQLFFEYFSIKLFKHNDNFNEILIKDDEIKKFLEYKQKYYSERDDLKNEYIFSYKNWKFHLLNKTLSSNELNSLRLAIGNNNIEQLIKNRDFSSLKSIYFKAFGKHKINETSLILLHYPTNNNRLSIIYANKCSNTIRTFNQLNCSTLLCGDITFNDDIMARLKNAQGERLFCVVQIPHHGSGKNWVEYKKRFGTPFISVVSFGKTNNYHHPSPKYLSDISLFNNYFVTEDNYLIYTI